MRIALYEPDIAQNTGTILRLAACLAVEAHIIEPLGSYDIVDLKVGDQMLRARTRAGYVGRAGDRVFARIDPTHAHFFDAGGQSLRVRL